MASQADTAIQWKVVRDFGPKIAAEMQASVTQVLESGAERIVANAQSRVQVKSGATRDSGHVETQGTQTYFAAFGGAALYLEFGTVHAKPYPFLEPAAMEEWSGILQELMAVTGSRSTYSSDRGAAIPGPHYDSANYE